MHAKITKKLVETVNATTSDLLIWDTQVPGFGVRCRVSGGKFYVVKYRAEGRQRWLTLGRHGHITAERARELAQSKLGQVVDGDDPAQERDARRMVLTMKELGATFLEEHVAVKNKSRTADEYRRIIEKFITPNLGSIRITNIGRDDIIQLHQKLKDTPYQANRVLAVLSSMFGLADKLGITKDRLNPCRNIEKFKERKIERFLNEDELVKVESALKEVEQKGKGTPYMWAAIRLLILTGARLNEILTLQWEHVDFDRCMLHLPDSKTGQKTIFLNHAAVAVLKNIPRILENPYVIVGKHEKEHLTNLKNPWQVICKKAGLQNVRIHDIRHSFASVAAASGMSLPMIGALLGHRHASTTARYAHLASPFLTEASNKIGAALLDMSAKKKEDASSSPNLKPKPQEKRNPKK